MDAVLFEGEEIPVTLIFSAARRSIGISVKNTGEVVVRAPVTLTKHEALSFAQSKASWIARHRAKFLARPAVVRTYADGERMPFFGRELTIRRRTAERKTVRAELSGDELILTLPSGLAPADASAAARDAVIFLFRRAGAAALSPFVQEYAVRAGVPVPALRVRMQERKWGCCTPKNGIIINVKVLLAPRIVAEYLVVHEIAHLRFRNHQQDFWNEVRRLMPEYEMAERIIKEEGWKWVF
ncbi:MAG: SprT family zinc-dependent metalloprotease [Methanocorpusculum sp.]|nr:SprT family zinc-dependent metalloprotease [Methanocorpusculum sp.]